MPERIFVQSEIIAFRKGALEGITLYLLYALIKPRHCPGTASGSTEDHTVPLKFGTKEARFAKIVETAAVIPREKHGNTVTVLT